MLHGPFKTCVIVSGVLACAASFADESLLPAPQKTPPVFHILTLKEAIALALRYNPDVLTADRQRIKDKYTLALGLYGFQWNWSSLTLGSTLQKQGGPTWAMPTLGGSLQMLSGTNVKANYTPSIYGGFGSATLDITQQLMGTGDWETQRHTYENLLDAEENSKLSFKDSIMGKVVDVIKNYRSIVEDYNNWLSAQRSLKSQVDALNQAKLEYKYGKISKNDLLQQESSLANTKLNTLTSKESMRKSYKAFLKLLGLNADDHIQVDHRITISKVKLPTFEKATKIALAHNINYQQQIISFRQAKRALRDAQIARKWTLSMEGSVTLGRQADGLNEPTTSQNINPSLTFTLGIPLNDLAKKQSIVSEQMDFANAKTSLHDAKQTLLRDIKSDLEGLRTNLQQVKQSEQQVKFQALTVKDDRIKKKYGQVSAFETRSDVDSLLEDQQSLISAKITYLNAVTDFYKTLGITLDRWHIKLRY